MSKPSKPSPPDTLPANDALTRLIGLGDRSIRKSYYPQLKKKITELETFQFLMDRAADSIFLVRVDPHSIEYANDAATTLMRLSKDEMLCASVSDVFGHQVAADLEKNLDADSGETIQATKDGLVLEMSVTSHVVNDAPYIVIVARDITQRVQAELELQRLQVLLKGIVESMPSTLIGVDMNGTISQWNRQAEQLTGIDSTLALKRPLAEVYPRLANLIMHVHRAVKEQSPQILSRVLHHRQGHLVYEDITVFPLDIGKDGGAVIRIDDITKRVHMEELMIQSEKMMSVGGLAAGMAHEINNPLGGILQGAQNIRRRLLEDIPANQEAADRHQCSLETIRAYMQERSIPKMLDGITNSGARAARIVTNMLNFSRKSDSQMAPNDLNAILDHALELASSDYNLKKKYDFRKITIIRDYSQQLPPLRCSATEIEQVLLNLLTNAAHAYNGTDEPAEGRTIRLGTSLSGDSAVIEIEDNGPGMDEETRKHIFEPFFTTKEPGVGTGLGLSVSYYIITQNHGGEFVVHSAPGQGTRFTISLPID
ncbi:ATP-binding protein [Desulfovibrio ferrophilus]|uniref:histidine kinase n=1 Tax=Desulfovibrio ferrophilus TaxID=241368 RepID=A0A2Z6B2Z1_9BACT|nr:ATP-binding protein [Desulfovibrio ferrophilus]BBD09833.1 PAS/PAC sensor signal transduction histidine kinase [Desulfovibrio ferrophilus]